MAALQTVTTTIEYESDVDQLEKEELQKEQQLEMEELSKAKKLEAETDAAERKSRMEPQKGI